MRLSSALSTALTIFVCVSCFGDAAYPPVVYNKTGTSVAITLKWSKGPNQPGVLPPGSKSFQRLEARHLTGLEVKHLPNGRIRHYDSKFLDTLRQHQGSKFEVWVIMEGDLQLAGEESLRKR